MCDWPIYDTLAVCYDCADYSDAMQYQCRSEDDEKLCGYYANATFSSKPVPQFYIGKGDKQNFTYLSVHNHHGLTSKRLQSRQWPLNSFTLAYSPWANRSELPVAIECLLYACVKRIKTIRKYNRFSSVIVNTTHGHSKVAPSFTAIEDIPPTSGGVAYNRSYIPYSADIIFDVAATNTAYPTLETSISDFLIHKTSSRDFLTNAVQYQSKPIRYVITSASANRMAWMLETRLNGRAIRINGTRPFRKSDYLVPFSDILANVSHTRPVLQKAIMQIAENISLGLTFDIMNRGKHMSGSNIKGKAYNLENHVNVRWVYITFPVLLTLATLVLVLRAMAASIHQNVPFWKSSTIATLLVNVEEGEDGSELATSRKLSDMEARAEEVRMRLMDDGETEAMRFAVCKTGP